MAKSSFSLVRRRDGNCSTSAAEHGAIRRESVRFRAQVNEDVPSRSCAMSAVMTARHSEAQSFPCDRLAYDHQASTSKLIHILSHSKLLEVYASMATVHLLPGISFVCGPNSCLLERASGLEAALADDCFPMDPLKDL